MANVVFSKAQPIDAPETEQVLVDVYGETERALAHNYLACMFSNDYRRPTFVVGKAEQKIVAVACYSEELFTVGTYGISWVAVLPEFQHKGIGQQLTETCVQYITQESAQPNINIILLTYPNQTGLYDRCGFESLGADVLGGMYMLQRVKK